MNRACLISWMDGTHQDTDGGAGDEDGEAAKVGVGDDGGSERNQVQGASNDVGDLRRVDALDVVHLE